MWTILGVSTEWGGNKVTKHDSSRSELEHPQNRNKNEIFFLIFDTKESLVSWMIWLHGRKDGSGGCKSTRQQAATQALPQLCTALGTEGNYHAHKSAGCRGWSAGQLQKALASDLSPHQHTCHLASHSFSRTTSLCSLPWSHLRRELGTTGLES